MSHSWLVLPNVWLCRPIGKVALSILMSSTWANTQHVFHWIRTHIHSQTSFMSSTWANTQSTGSYDKQPDYSPVVKNLSVVPLSIGDKIACRLINTTSSHYHRDRPLERDHLPPHQTPFCLPFGALPRMSGMMFKSELSTSVSFGRLDDLNA